MVVGLGWARAMRGWCHVVLPSGGGSDDIQRFSAPKKPIGGDV